MSAGIDYGMGTTNVDKKTGIRYGVISANSVGQALADAHVDFDYGDPTCPKCGNEVKSADNIDAELDQFGRGCADFVCWECKCTIDSSDVYGDDAQGWSFEEEGYQLTNCLDNDVFVLASPYYTTAMFCSPCVPGAGNLDDFDKDGVETYCLGHDWFEDGKAPYKVYSVATREEVAP